MELDYISTEQLLPRIGPIRLLVQVNDEGVGKFELERLVQINAEGVG